MNSLKLQTLFKSGAKLLKKEELYLWKKLRDKADTVFSIFIRTRDRKDGCITCNGPVQHNCHWIDRGWYSHRWDENNCKGGCANCNTYRQEEHKVLFTIYQTKKFGQERIDEQILKRHKKKPSIQDLLDIIEKYS